METETPVEQKEANIQSGETVLVFGQGPVIAQTSERINYWSEDLAQAAAELKKRDPNIKNFIVMGGKTGGPDNASEAELIAIKMAEAGVDPQDVQEEGLSDDTIENIVNFLNMQTAETNNPHRAFDILCAPYHSPRTQVLMQLFAVPVNHVFHSTEVLRFAARAPLEVSIEAAPSSEWNSNALQSVEDKVNINDPTKYSSLQPPEEQRDVLDRYIKDDLWTRELLEYPEKWLPYVGKLTDNNRVAKILNQVNILYPNMLEDKYDINPEEAEHDQTLSNVKAKLSSIPAYKGLPKETVQQWVEENKSTGWPEQPKAVLHQLLEMRSNPSSSDILAA